MSPASCFIAAAIEQVRRTSQSRTQTIHLDYRGGLESAPVKPSIKFVRSQRAGDCVVGIVREISSL